jgi:hypothetical protein
MAHRQGRLATASAVSAVPNTCQPTRYLDALARALMERRDRGAVPLVRVRNVLPGQPRSCYAITGVPARLR